MNTKQTHILLGTSITLQLWLRKWPLPSIWYKHVIQPMQPFSYSCNIHSIKFELKLPSVYHLFLTCIFYVCASIQIITTLQYVRCPKRMHMNIMCFIHVYNINKITSISEIFKQPIKFLRRNELSKGKKISFSSSNLFLLLQCQL